MTVSTAARVLGEWRPLASGEDVDLVERAGRAGLNIRRTGRIPVRTSARRVGRAPEGFSSYVRSLGGPDLVTVSGP